MKKRLPVQVDWTGQLAAHLILESADIQPKFVKVVGGSKILEQINTIYTEKVALDTIDKSGSLPVNLALNPASLKIDQAANRKVTITYVVNLRPKPIAE